MGSPALRFNLRCSMSIQSHIDHARTRVQTEQESTDAKLAAFEAFLDRVADIPVEPTPSSPRMTATAGTLSRGTPSTEDRCRSVRTAFAETIGSHSDGVDGTESLLATIQSEFSEQIAVALAPTTETAFSPELKEQLVSEATARRTEVAVLRRALVRERTHLGDAADVVDEITAWIADADETPLTALDFDALQHRHETLARYRDQCDGLARQRQQFLRKTTNQNVEAGIRHRSLVLYLYEDFPVDHPLLATAARLDSACAECQRAIRSHLVRRV